MQAGRWAHRRGAGRAGGRLGRAAGRGRRAGRCAAGAPMAGSGVQGARGVRSRGAVGARPGRGRRAAWARQAHGLGAERAGWPWAVHSVHSTHFRSVLTRFFS